MNDKRKQPIPRSGATSDRGVPRTARHQNASEVTRNTGERHPHMRENRQEAGWVHPERRPGPGPQRYSAEYTQMPLRPMTSMPKDRRETPARPEPPYAQRRQEQHGIPQRQPSPKGPRRPSPEGYNAPPGRENTLRPTGEPAGRRPAPREGISPQRNQRSAPSKERRRPAPAPTSADNRRRPTPPKNGQRGVPQRNAQPRPERRPENHGWVIPEGSPVYTAEGRMYDPQSRQYPKRPPQRGPQRGPNGGRRPDPRNQKRPPQNNRPPKKVDKKKKQERKEKALFYTKTILKRFAALLLISALLMFWWYRAEFFSDTDKKRGTVSFTFEGVGSYEADAATAYRSDVLYVDFTEIAEWFGMVSVGSVNSMRFICTDMVSETSSGQGGEEYAIFKNGSATAIVNGVSLCLEAECRSVDSHIWVPLSFVEGYIAGVVCDRGAKGTDVVFALENAEELEDNEEIIVNASYKVKPQTPLTHVEYPK